MVWLKRRWKCGNPACGRATFTESLPQVPARARLTARLRDHAAHLVGELGVPVDTAAEESGVSWPTAHQAFTEQADPVLCRPLWPVRVLGIDETRRGRPRFATDPDTGEYVQLADRWHTGFVDIDGEQGLLGQVEGRTADDAAYWLAQAGPAWLHRVQVVAGRHVHHLRRRGPADAPRRRPGHRRVPSRAVGHQDGRRRAPPCHR